MNRDHKKYLRNTLNFYIFVLASSIIISNCITNRYRVTKVCWDVRSVLSSEISEEDIEYCNNLKPTNNHVSGEHQF